jgi:hypothetical protein
MYQRLIKPWFDRTVRRQVRKVARLVAQALSPYLITVLSILLASTAWLVFLYATADHVARENLKAELMTVLMQLVVIGIIGALVPWMLTERSREKEGRVHRQDALNEFRRNTVTRVVKATNVVRRAPILVEAYRSKKTYDEQARRLLDARLDLGLVRHDLESAKGAFTRIQYIAEKIAIMEGYLKEIVDEWVEWKHHYEEQAKPPGDPWNEIKNLPALKDLRTGDETSRFHTKYILQGHREALKFMRQDIFGPDDQNGSDTEILKKFLPDVTFPAEKEQVASTAESNDATPVMVQKIRNANTQRYSSLEEVQQALQGRL